MLKCVHKVNTLLIEHIKYKVDNKKYLRTQFSEQLNTTDSSTDKSANVSRGLHTVCSFEMVINQIHKKYTYWLTEQDFSAWLQDPYSLIHFKPDLKVMQVCSEKAFRH